MEHATYDIMEVGTVKIADDGDFMMLKSLVDDNTDWKLEYDKSDDTKVWSQTMSSSCYKMVKMKTVLKNISSTTLFDVLHDPDYRKEWDGHMLASIEIGYLNPNNDVGYYAISCPPPLKNRDFVLQRSWLDLGDEKLLLNHSVNHKDYPPKKGFVRATSHLTGFVIRQCRNGCFLGYISQTDPKGKLPHWLVNTVTNIFVPKMVKQLKKATARYELWKATQTNPLLKPWTYPEQTLFSPRVKISDCVLLKSVTIDVSVDLEED